MTIETIELEGCTDCIMWLANGELPDEGDWTPDAIKTKWDGYHVCVAGDGNTENHFSWQPCDVCGSRLGGDRYPCAAWKCE